MRATSYSVLAGFCEVKLELVVAGSRPLCFVFLPRNRQASPRAALWPRAVPAGRGALGRGLPARSGTKRPSPWEQKAPLVPVFCDYCD
jgi:hypothetical protein